MLCRFLGAKERNNKSRVKSSPNLLGISGSYYMVVPGETRALKLIDFLKHCDTMQQQRRKFYLQSHTLLSRYSTMSDLVSDHVVKSNTHFFFIRNSFIRNLYWDGQIAEKPSVLKSQRLRNF